MRRMRQNLKHPVYLRRAVTIKDDEGNTYHQYSAPIELMVIARHAAHDADAAQYGERLTGIIKMQYEGNETISLYDGVCVNVAPTDAPDYIVKGIKGLTPDTFRVYTLEAV